MGETVRGFQSAGVQATAKHFLLNEQEIMRNPALVDGGFAFEAVSSNADDRTIRGYPNHEQGFILFVRP